MRSGLGRKGWAGPFLDSAMVLRTDIKTLVMAALAEGPRHGYILAQSLRESLGAHQRIEGGQVYVALRGLEAKGWVTAEWEEGSVERRTYRLTEEGVRELGWRTAEWRACAEAIAEVLLPNERLHPSPRACSQTLADS